MKNIKALIIIICIIISILITMILLMLNVKKGNNNIPNEIASEEEKYNITKELKNVTIRNDFYTVKTCVEKFYNIYADIFNSTSGNFMIEGEALESVKREQETNITAIYNMLDQEYIKYANITQENLLNKLQKVNRVDIEIDRMYVSQQTENIYVYFIYGNLLDINEIINKDFSTIVKIDTKSKTFKLYLEDYVKEKYSNIKNGDNIQISIEETIKNDNDNTYQYKIITDEAYITDLFNGYVKDLLYNKSRAYRLLDSEYLAKRFNSQNDFENYIKNNLYKIATMKLNKYQKTEKDGNVQYVCIDKNKNYYIFKEVEKMKYSVILDMYTLDLPEFLEKYTTAKEEDKVLLNLQKCFEAINNKDYEYVYNKLDNTFRTNNFKTLASFEKYIKTNMFETNSVSSSKKEAQGDVYMYELTIKDSTGKNTAVVKKIFAMQLKENTNFVISFEI